MPTKTTGTAPDAGGSEWWSGLDSELGLDCSRADPAPSVLRGAEDAGEAVVRRARTAPRCSLA